MIIELLRDCAHGRKGKRFDTKYDGWCNMLIRSNLAKEIVEPEKPVTQKRHKRTERAVTHG